MVLNLTINTAIYHKRQRKPEKANCCSLIIKPIQPNTHVITHIAMYLLAVFLAAAATNAKIIALNKDVAWKDYPAACERHNAVPLILSSSQVGTALNVLGKLNQENTRGWIATFEDNELDGMSVSFGEDHKVQKLPTLEINNNDKKGLKNVSLCWKGGNVKEKSEEEKEVKKIDDDDDLHVDTTSPESEEAPAARQDKPRRRHHKREESSKQDREERSTKKKDREERSTRKKDREERSKKTRKGKKSSRRQESDESSQGSSASE